MTVRSARLLLLSFKSRLLLLSLMHSRGWGKHGGMGVEQEMDILAYYYWNGNENGMYKILRGE